MLAELEITDLAKYFYKLAERSEDVFWIMSADYQNQLYVGPAFEKIWGQSPQKLYQTPDSWIEMVVPEDREIVLAEIEKVKVSQVSETYPYKFRIKRPDGEIRWIQDICFPLFDANNERFGYAGIAKDVTEKQHLIELEEATRIFQFFAEKTRSVFWVYDPIKKKQIYVSPAYEKVWGRSCESLYNDPNTWLDAVVPEDYKPNTSLDARLQKLEQHGPDFQYEDRYRIMHPSGTIIWIKDTSFPIYNRKNKFLGFAGIAEDITKEVLHEKQLEEAKLRAEEANQAKADFLAMMSHELRTPLNAILGMAQILRMKGIPEELDDCVSIISQSGNNLLSLVNDILDFAKLEVGSLSFAEEPLDLQLLISQVISSLHSHATEKGIALKLDYADDAPTLVFGDAKRVRQILVNLLGNALKFTMKGYIEARVRCVNLAAKQTTLSITIIDTGIGIPQNKLGFIFERFSQVDSIYQRKYTGTGLGLAISKELVERMGGTIQVSSQVGKGSEFNFTLPFHLPLSILERPLQPRMEREPNKKFNCNLHVLLVEDNSINQKIAKIMLEDIGCSVDILDHGQAVLNNLFKLDSYDIIFMDIGLPDISGFDVVTHIRRHDFLNNTPIIAMTAHILERDKQRCFVVGMDDIIAKPISHEELIKTVQYWVEKSVLRSC